MAQFTVMRVMSSLAPIPINALAATMVMESTGIKRLIRPLLEAKLVATESGPDKRVNNLVLTRKDAAITQSTKKFWNEA